MAQPFSSLLPEPAPRRRRRARLVVASDPSMSAERFFEPAPSPESAPSWTADAFSEDVWRARDPNPGAGGTESVSFETIPEPFRLTVKELLRALDQTASFGRRRAKSAGTAKTLIAICRHFTQSLSAAGLTSFSSATREHVERAHLDYCGLLGGEPITATRAARYLGVLKRLHDLGPAGQKSLSDGLSFDPTLQAIHVGRSRALPDTESTPEMAEETGRALMLMAIDWVENKAEAALWVIQAAGALSSAKSASKRGRKDQAGALAAVREHVAQHPDFMAGLQRARETFGQGPLRSFLALERRPKPHEGLSDLEADCLAMGLIAQQIQLIFQGFCYAVCAGFNGWRANEIFSIDPDAIQETPAGFSIATRVRKTALTSGDLAARPVPPIVAQAVAALAKLNGEAALHRAGPDGSQTPDQPPLFSSTAGAQIDTHDMSERLTAAWRHFSGSDERLTTHQFRRFFALFYLRRHRGNLDAIRRHFRHVSREMVWAYVKDGLNASYLAKEKKALSGEIARSVVFGQGYASSGVAKELQEARRSLRYRGKTLSVEDAARFIESQIQSAFVELHAMEWGYCLFQRGEQGAACEAKTGPIEARSEPETCGRCKFLCTGSENVEFWQQSALLHQEILAHPKTIPIMRAQSERALATAANILARHAGEPSSGETP